uniref:Uncharacterized protein n=1 Tax=Lutzomyia longipalpis TaxID=7200 RepID=A0A1B0CGH2_LUTLO
IVARQPAGNRLQQSLSSIESPVLVSIKKSHLVLSEILLEMSTISANTALRILRNIPGISHTPNSRLPNRVCDRDTLTDAAGPFDCPLSSNSVPFAPNEPPAKEEKSLDKGFPDVNVVILRGMIDIEERQMISIDVCKAHLCLISRPLGFIGTHKALRD